MPDGSRTSPRLARPSFATGESALGDGARVPAFPEIGAEWEGFCLPHLHCVGIHSRLTDDLGNLRRILAHERGHWYLNWLPLPRAVNATVVSLWLAVDDLAHGRETAEQHPERRELAVPVHVPLLADPSGIRLGRLWAEFLELKERTDLVDEVFAIWFSLNETQGDEPLRRSRARRADVEERYKLTYEPGWPGFTALYDLFRPIADQVGSEGAVALVTQALATPTPARTLTAMLVRARQDASSGELPTDPDALTGRYAPIAAEHLLDEEASPGLRRELLRHILEGGRAGDESARTDHR